MLSTTVGDFYRISHRLLGMHAELVRRLSCVIRHEPRFIRRKRVRRNTSFYGHSQFRRSTTVYSDGVRVKVNFERLVTRPEFFGLGVGYGVKKVIVAKMNYWTWIALPPYLRSFT